jgi:CubicO group peptidase (beta-lactamase class C family)
MGFIILGKAVERITGVHLNEYVKQEIFDPLGMETTFYNPPKKFYSKIAPTEYDSARGGMVQSKVHDENAYYLGGVSGNAGLFSNVHDLAIFSQMMLNKGIYKGTRIYKSETVELFTKQQNIPEGSSRCLGWGAPEGRSSSGHYFSQKSYGHTGFTGTSIWIDDHKNLFGILLTNRVHPTRKHKKIYKIRRKLYDKLQEAVQDYPLTKNPNVYKNE